MAVLGRLLVSSGERIDLPDLLSIDSYGAGDWQYFMKTLVGSETPYIIKGFDIINPAGSIGTQSCSVNIAESAMFYPGAKAGSFYYGLPAGHINAQPLIPELRKNATNYVYLTFTTINKSQDTRAFWDPDANGGAGSEFTQEINTESVIEVQINVSTGSFPENTVPVAIVIVGPSVINSIEDARPMMFRLGMGGVNPNPVSRYDWRALPSTTYERLETPNTLTSGVGQNPFQGGDKNILSLKEWMDAVMTKLVELGGTQYWYEDTSTFSIVSIFHDALATTFKSKGAYLHSSGTPGQLSYTEDVQIISVSDPRQYIVRAGTILMPNDNVAYLPLVRLQPINLLDQAVTWTNAATYVNTPDGSIGYFANLIQGDWIKKAGDDSTLFLRVEQFYAGTNLSGGTTTPANAKSILLSGAYQGTSGNDIAKRDKGVYLSTDLQIQSRNNPAIDVTGGNFFWFAYRGDVIEGIASVSSVTLAGTLAAGNQGSSQITSVAHGLIDSDQVTITAPAAYAGTYSVDIIDVDTFTISTPVTSAGGALTAYYALLTTAATSNGFGLQLESANHGFESGETINISNTTNWNGDYVVNYRSATQIQIPIGSAIATENSGNATLARLDVRTERGISKVVQGETINIGENDSENIQSFIGMSSLAETSPTYFLPPGYNTFNGAVNYNSLSNDNLTQRASNLTAMMADKAQDKTIQFLTTADSVLNTKNGAAQEITFQPPGSTLTLVQPGSPGNAVVTLPDSAPGISLLVNQTAYVYIDRDAGSTPAIQIANTSLVPVDENIFVVASRLNDEHIYLWNGNVIINSGVLVPSYPALVKVNYHDVISTTLPVGAVNIDSSSVVAGNLVLFSNLTVGDNSIYKALGVGPVISGWQLQYLFNGYSSPAPADTVIVQAGAAFKDQVGEFNTIEWVFNDKVRYFNGADYWEQSNIVSSTLPDNTSGNVFTVNVLQNEHMIVDYSIVRGATRETGTLHITTNSSSVVNVTTSGANIGVSGVNFSGNIAGPSLNLAYTTTSTGSHANMKYMIRRWSDGSGGPGSIPNYLGLLNPPIPAAGPFNTIQYNNGGFLDGNSNFEIDTVDLSINLNGLRQSVLSSGLTVIDNSAFPAILFTYDAALYPFAIIEYSILRNGIYRVGRLLVANNGTITTDNDDYVETGATGVSLSATIIGPNVVIEYTSSNLGFNGTFKYSMRRWA